MRGGGSWVLTILKGHNKVTCEQCCFWRLSHRAHRSDPKKGQLHSKLRKTTCGHLLWANKSGFAKSRAKTGRSIQASCCPMKSCGHWGRFGKTGTQIWQHRPLGWGSQRCSQSFRLCFVKICILEVLQKALK